MSSRTIPQDGVAIPKSFRSPLEIATPVFALARNDMRVYLLLLLVRWSARMPESLLSDSDMNAFSRSSKS